MATLQEDNEMTDLEIRLKYGALIEEAVTAFSLDAGYAADIINKAKLKEAQRARRKT